LAPHHHDIRSFNIHVAIALSNACSSALASAPAVILDVRWQFLHGQLVVKIKSCACNKFKSAASFPFRFPVCRPLPRQDVEHPPRPACASRRAAPRHRRRRRAPELAPRPSPRARAAAAAQRLHARPALASSAAERCPRLCGGGKPRAGNRDCQREREREDDVALANARPAPRHGGLRRQDSGAYSLALRLLARQSRRRHYTPCA
jgi:hypothetical protein